MVSGAGDKVWVKYGVAGKCKIRLSATVMAALGSCRHWCKSGAVTLLGF